MAPSTAHSSRNSAGIGILTGYYILLSIATWLVCLRCSGRIRFQHGLDSDDMFIMMALIFLIIGAILLTIEVANGLGRHFADLSNPENSALQVLKYNIFFQMDNVLCTLVTKISISIYILRIKNSRFLRHLLWILMIFMSLATLAVIVVLSLSCVPLSALWTPSLQPHAKCLALKTEYNVAYVQSAFTIITDLFLTISPIVILWNVRIKTGKKIRICSLMSLGLMATISNALRNVFQAGLTSKDPTYDEVPVTIVAVLELSFGIIAACIPACMPFVTFRKKNERSWYSLSKTSHTQAVHDRSDIEPTIPVEHDGNDASHSNKKVLQE